MLPTTLDMAWEAGALANLLSAWPSRAHAPSDKGCYHCTFRRQNKHAHNQSKTWGWGTPKHNALIASWWDHAQGKPSAPNTTDAPAAAPSSDLLCKPTGRHYSGMHMPHARQPRPTNFASRDQQRSLPWSCPCCDALSKNNTKGKVGAVNHTATEVVAGAAVWPCALVLV